MQDSFAHKTQVVVLNNIFTVTSLGLKNTKHQPASHLYVNDLNKLSYIPGEFCNYNLNHLCLNVSYICIKRGHNINLTMIDPRRILNYNMRI